MHKAWRNGKGWGLRDWGVGEQGQTRATSCSLTTLSCGQQRSQVVLLAQGTHSRFLLAYPDYVFSFGFQPHFVFLSLPTLLISYKAKSKVCLNQSTEQESVSRDTMTETFLSLSCCDLHIVLLLSPPIPPYRPQHAQADSLEGKERGDCQGRGCFLSSCSLTWYT